MGLKRGVRYQVWSVPDIHDPVVLDRAETVAGGTPASSYYTPGYNHCYTTLTISTFTFLECVVEEIKYFILLVAKHRSPIG